jgi:hypothetical protein
MAPICMTFTMGENVIAMQLPRSGVQKVVRVVPPLQPFLVTSFTLQISPGHCSFDINMIEMFMDIVRSVGVLKNISRCRGSSRKLVWVSESI